MADRFQCLDRLSLLRVGPISPATREIKISGSFDVAPTSSPATSRTFSKPRTLKTAAKHIVGALSNAVCIDSVTDVGESTCRAWKLPLTARQAKPSAREKREIVSAIIEQREQTEAGNLQVLALRRCPTSHDGEKACFKQAKARVAVHSSELMRQAAADALTSDTELHEIYRSLSATAHSKGVQIWRESEQRWLSARNPSLNI